MFCCSPQSAQSQSDIHPPPTIKKIVNTAEPARTAEPEKKGGARFGPDTDNDAGKSTMEGESGGNREAMKSIYAAKTQASLRHSSSTLQYTNANGLIILPCHPGWAHSSYPRRSWSQEWCCEGEDPCWMRRY